MLDKLTTNIIIRSCNGTDKKPDGECLIMIVSSFWSIDSMWSHESLSDKTELNLGACLTMPSHVNDYSFTLSHKLTFATYNG